MSAPRRARRTSTRACRSGNMCWSRSRTPAPASRPRSSTRSSTPSTPPRISARAPGSGSRPSTASSSRPAASSTSSRARQGHDLPHLPAALHSGGRRPAGAAICRRRPRRRSPAPSPRPTPCARAATDLTGHGTILLVEDEEELRALNARGLKSRGYTVIEAGNGVEALEELERQGRQRRSRGVRRGHAGNGRADADEGAASSAIPTSRSSSCPGYAEDAFDKSLPDHKQFNFLAKPFTLKQLVTVGEGRRWRGERPCAAAPCRCSHRAGRNSTADSSFAARGFARYDAAHERATRTGQIRRRPRATVGSPMRCCCCSWSSSSAAGSGLPTPCSTSARSTTAWRRAAAIVLRRSTRAGPLVYRFRRSYHLAARFTSVGNKGTLLSHSPDAVATLATRRPLKRQRTAPSPQHRQRPITATRSAP